MADQGKESIFLGLSKSETDGNGKDSDRETKFKTAYALYRYHTNGATDYPSPDEPLPVPSYSHSRKRTPEKNFSTELLLSTVDQSDETDLKNFVTRKLSKGSMTTSSGNISAIDLQLGEDEPGLYLCYYCLLKQKDSGPAATVTADDLAKLGLDSEDIKCDVPQPDDGSNELLVCLIAPAHSQLDLFKPDLDRLCSQLLAKLDFELFLLFDLDDTEETNDVIRLAKPMLDTWFESMSSYVSHCVQMLGSDIKYLIHAALIDASMDIRCSDEKLKSDINRFFEVCSLSGLLSNDSSKHSVRSRTSYPPSEGQHLLVDLNSPGSSCLLSRQKSTVTFTLTIEDDVCSFCNQGCTKYCEDWSLALDSCEIEDHVQLRNVIENYKLKTIQDMNTLSRLLKQAETDHYSLYRCLMFLKQCGNEPILLQYAEQALCQTDQSDTEQILHVLQDNLVQIDCTAR